jgi:hypothetical protein
MVFAPGFGFPSSGGQPDVARGDLDVEFDAQPLRQPRQRGQKGCLVAAFQAGDDRLHSAALAGQLGLGQFMLGAVDHKAFGERPGERGAIPLLPESRLLQGLGQHLLSGGQLRQLHHQPSWAVEPWAAWPPHRGAGRTLVDQLIAHVPAGVWVVAAAHDDVAARLRRHGFLPPVGGGLLCVRLDVCESLLATLTDIDHRDNASDDHARDDHDVVACG